MDEKQKQQHRQHFNLSESAKQMLDELTAKRYPGRQRRQSQLVEDLITEAFGKEQNMSTVTTGMHEPEPERFAPSTRQAIAMARQEAVRMDAAEVYAEHLLLGVIAQGESKAAKLLCMYGLDMQAIRVRATEVFSSHYAGLANDSVVLSSEAKMCIKRAEWFAIRSHTHQVLPEELVLSVLHYLGITSFGVPFQTSINTLMTRLSEGMGEWESRLALDPALFRANRFDRRVVLEGFAEGKSDLEKADAWSTAEQRYKPDQVVPGVITRVSSFGAFVRLDEGIEGLVHLAELPSQITLRDLHEGLQVQVRILSIDASRRRMRLSLMGEAGGSPASIARDVLAAQSTSATNLCPSCKREIQSRWKHCVYCGASLTRVCLKCGVTQPGVEGAKYCFECGSELG